MSSAKSVLGRFRKRYLIVGTFALRLYGFDLKPQDVDIWLDPTLSYQQWKHEVFQIAGPCKVEDMSRRLKKRFLLHMRIYSEPNIDVLGFVMKLWPNEFSSQFESAPLSEYGPLMPIKTLLAAKWAGFRAKDRETLNLVLHELLEACDPPKRQP